MSRLKFGARRLGQAVRPHRGIENSQHWVLDVGSRDDDRRSKTATGANLLR